jgi:hypothetical protein
LKSTCSTYLGKHSLNDGDLGGDLGPAYDSSEGPLRHVNSTCREKDRAVRVLRERKSRVTRK